MRMSKNDFEEVFDVKLHKIYYLMNAYWYGTDEVKDEDIVISTYEAFVDDLYHDEFGLSESEFEKLLDNIIEEYVRSFAQDVF